MISNSDLEKAWFLYKTEYEPQNISINDFCMRKGIPHREFNKWFRNTHKQVVPVEVEGVPYNSEPAPSQSDPAKVSNIMSPRKTGIHGFILYNFWDRVFAYRNDGEYSIDKMAVERAIRTLTVQRKNSLFFCSPKGAKNSGIFNTFISTCQ